MSDVKTKFLAEIRSLPDSNDFPNGSFQIVLSTSTKDREGDELKTDEWELPLPDHITMDVDHGMSVEKTVGSGKPYIDDLGRMIVNGGYASTSLGQNCRALVNEGHIRTVSVAFLTKVTKNPDGTKSIKRELLNGAFVAIPANTEAVVIESKALDVEAKALSEAKMKSIIGSVEALQERVADAIEDANELTYNVIRGVIPNADGGVVVFDSYDMDAWECQTFQQSFSDDGSVVILVGESKPVDIFEVVLPDGHEDLTEI